MTDWLDQVDGLRPNEREPPPPQPTMFVPAGDDTWVEEPNPFYTEPAPIAEALAAVHAGFERIHPFLDGNGRTGRLLTNLILVRLGYPPAIVQKRERSDYLTALKRADTGMSAHSENCSPERSSTISIASSSQPWPALRGKFRSKLWPRPP